MEDCILTLKGVRVLPWKYDDFRLFVNKGAFMGIVNCGAPFVQKRHS